ncbi:hypothetical protein ECZU06_03690 [Escherichia coli]|nr:hypothetical protein ECZU06_03690 [Escherichia coli]GHK89072.1 hypothetical protein ECZU17_50090 [Escherichia coli]GHL28146.1 hypothetical protein ECZU25_49590 [Escherichia coli]GHL82573.1 hypothetical protein ECZU36_38570 [Escherichia coli]
MGNGEQPRQTGAHTLPFRPSHSATITSRAINNAPTAAMVVDTSVAINACGNCGSANNACQCVNDKAGDISVRAAGISGA